MPRLSVSRVTRVLCRNKAAGAIARIHERASSRSSQTSTDRVTEIANDAAPKRHGGSRDPCRRSPRKAKGVLYLVGGCVVLLSDCTAQLGPTQPLAAV